MCFAIWWDSRQKRSPSQRWNSCAGNGLSLPSQPADSSGRYVSRGGQKLRGALDAFRIDVQGKVCVDIGSSTGGFTDCLLQAGAKSVWAVDVGWGLLDYKLRNDPRVHVLERTNFRHLEPKTLTEKPDLITIDVSFISLSRIFPKIAEITNSGEIVALVKPQFEGTPKEAPGGFVKNEETRQAILTRVRILAQEAGYHIEAVADSVLPGRQGNQETFFHLARKETQNG